MRRTIPVSTCLAGIVLATALSRLLVANLGILGVDEVVTTLVARTVTQGQLPYLGAADHRGPLLYLFYALPLLMHPGSTGSLADLEAVRFFFALLVAGTAILPYLIVHRILPHWGAWSASITYAVIQWVGVYHAQGMHSEDFWGAQPEFILNALGLAALYLLSRGGSSLIAGVLMGCSVLVKQHALFELCYGALLVVWYQGRCKGVRFVVGATVPLLVVCTTYGVNDSLGEFLYYFWQYNASGYLPEVTLATKCWAALQGIGNLGTGPASGFLAIALCSILPSGTGGDTSLSGKRFIITLWGWFAITLGAASLSGRGFAHYYIQLLPPLSLLTAFGVRHISTIVAERLPRATIAVPIGFCTLCLCTILYEYNRHLPLDRASKEFLLYRDEALTVANRLRSSTTPLFVWGFYPELYLLTERPPASRYLYSSFLTGHGAWMKRPGDIEFTLPLREQLIADLQRSHPEYIVHVTTRGFTFPLVEEPLVGTYITAHYHRAHPSEQGNEPHFIIYRRDDDGASAGATTTESAQD